MKYMPLRSRLKVYDHLQKHAKGWHEPEELKKLVASGQKDYQGPGWADQAHGVGPKYWEPYETSAKGQLDWQKEHIMNGHGAPGALYPPRMSDHWGDEQKYTLHHLILEVKDKNPIASLFDYRRIVIDANP